MQIEQIEFMALRIFLLMPIQVLLVLNISGIASYGGERQGYRGMSPTTVIILHYDLSLFWDCNKHCPTCFQAYLGSQNGLEMPFKKKKER